jgi:hypothetical protein
LLIEIQVEAGYALSGFKQRHNYVHGKGGFAAATFLIADDDDVRR